MLAVARPSPILFPLAEILKQTVIREISKDFIQFLLRPNDKQSDVNILNSSKILFLLLVFESIFTLIIILPIDYGIDKIVTIRESSFDYSETILYSFFGFVILIPFIEELVFRYFLRYKGLVAKFFSRNKWNKMFPFFVYFSSIAFGILHISNYDGQSYLFYIFSPLIIISQLFGGLIISYIRVRLSFIWGVLYHCFWNLIFAIFVPLIVQQFSDPFSEKTSNYSINVSEQPFFNKDISQKIKIDSLNGKVTKIQVQQYSLQNVIDTLYSKNKYYVDDVLINMNFKSDKGIDKRELLKILKKEYEIE